MRLISLSTYLIAGLTLAGFYPDKKEDSKKEDEKPRIQKLGAYGKFDRKDLKPVDYSNSKQVMPLINFSDIQSIRGIHLVDKNKDDILDEAEITDYFNIAFDNGDGFINGEEYGNILWGGVRFVPRYNASDTLPDNPDKLRTNIEVTRENYHLVFSKLTTEFYSEEGNGNKHYAKLGEGNIPRARINQVLIDIAQTEKLTVAEGEITKEINSKLTKLGFAFEYLRTDNKFKQAIKTSLLRQKAVQFLLENKNPEAKWMDKLFVK